MKRMPIVTAAFISPNVVRRGQWEESGTNDEPVDNNNHNNHQQQQVTIKITEK